MPKDLVLIKYRPVQYSVREACRKADSFLRLALWIRLGTPQVLKEWRLGSEVWHEGRKLGVQDLHLLIGVLQEHKELNIGTIRLIKAIPKLL